MNWIKNILLVILSTTISLFILEIVIRSLEQPPYEIKTIPNMYKSDDELGFIYNPNWKGVYSDIEFNLPNMKINSFGIRDYEHNKDSNKSKLLIVGDSFAFGQGVKVDKTFGGLIEKLTNYEVIKAGVMSYSPRQSYGMMKRMVMEFNPKIVVFTFYEGNDYGDDLVYGFKFPTSKGGFIFRYGDNKSIEQMNKERDEFYKNTTETYYGTSNEFLLSSKLYKFVKMKLIQSNLIKNPFLKKENKMYICPLPIYGNYLQEGFPNQDENSKRQWESTKSILKLVQEYTKKQNIKLILVIIPDKIQVNDNLNNFYANKCSNLQSIFSKDVFSPFRANKILEEYSKSLDIDTLNMVNIFKENGNVENIYFKKDVHLSEYGHSLVAETIIKHINTN